MQFISKGSVRPLKMNRRSLTGYVVLRSGQKAGYESSLERDLLMTLDFDPRVVQIQEQPYTLRYWFDGKERPYTPDVLATFEEDGRAWTVVYEVKYREDLRENWTLLRPRFCAAVRDCRQKGWRFKIVTEKILRTPQFSNVKFLRRHHGQPASERVQASLLALMEQQQTFTPQGLLNALGLEGDPRAMALHDLWHLVAHRRIAASLDAPLTMLTPLKTKPS